MTYVDALYGGPRDALHCKKAAHEAMNLHSSILLIMFKYCVKRDLYCHHLPQLMFTVPSFPARLQWPCRPCADSTFGARGGTAVQGAARLCLLIMCSFRQEFRIKVQQSLSVWCSNVRWFFSSSKCSLAFVVSQCSLDLSICFVLEVSLCSRPLFVSKCITAPRISHITLFSLQAVLT